MTRERTTGWTMSQTLRDKLSELSASGRLCTTPLVLTPEGTKERVPVTQSGIREHFRPLMEDTEITDDREWGGVRRGESKVGING